MKKVHTLRRILLPCFIPPPPQPPPPPPTTIPTTKKRLSTSLRDDLTTTTTTTTSTSSSSPTSPHSTAPPRPSKSMVTCTFFGQRTSHVFFCVQLHRLDSKPSLLLELSLSTHSLVKEMRTGLLRIALEANSDLRSCPLHSVPVWSVFCNGRRVGSAAKRRPTDDTKLMLKKMENTTVGAGVIPCGPGPGQEVMYMRANYEWVVGGYDSESFHLISPDDCPGQELSVFLLRSR